MNILILNVHSALNLGDDAIMRSTINSIKQFFPGAEVTVAANDPESWSHYSQFNVVSSLCTWIADCKMGDWRSGVFRTPFYLIFLIVAAAVFRLFRRQMSVPDEEKQRLLDAYFRAELVLSCGGGNFYAHHSVSPSLVWNLISLAFAQGLGKDVIMLPQSIGPIEGTLQRWFSKQVLRRVGEIMVREPVSHDFIVNTLKISEAKCAILPDLAFGIPEAGVFQEFKEIAGRDQLSVGITILDRGSQNKEFKKQSIYEQAVIDIASKLAQEHNACIFLFVQCYGPSPDQDDRHVTARLYSRFREITDQVRLLDGFSSSLEIRAALGRMDIVIATRMHTAIFSILNKVPAVLIGYQPKSRGLMTSFGLGDYYCDIDAVTPDQLYSSVKNLLAERDALTAEMGNQAEQARDMARSWVKRIVV